MSIYGYKASSDGLEVVNKFRLSYWGYYDGHYGVVSDYLSFGYYWTSTALSGEDDVLVMEVNRDGKSFDTKSVSIKKSFGHTIHCVAI